MRRAIAGRLLLALLAVVLAGVGGVARVAAGEPLRWGTFRVESAVPPGAVGWDGRLGVEGRAVAEAPLEPALKSVLLLYARAGYPFASVEPGAFDLVDGAVAATLRIDPGVRAIVDGLVLDGARVTRPGTALRIAGLRGGLPYTGFEDARVRERLLRSGLFVSVGEPRVEPGPTDSTLVLRVPVVEPPYTRFRGVLGVSGRDARVTGLADLELKNIAGTGREGAARWEGRGEGLARYELRYREPWLPFVPVGLFGELRHDVKTESYSFTDWQVGGDLSLGSAWRFRLGLGGSRAIETVENGLDTQERFAVAGVEMDRRNSLFAPTAGERVAIESRRGEKRFQGSDGAADLFVDRTRWRIDAEAYRRFGARWVGALATSFRFLDTPEDTVPRYDLFAVGGATTLRGYREEQFLTAGAWIVQAEWRLLQDDAGSAVYFFTDGGLLSSGSTAGRRDAFDRFVLGYGVGVRQAGKAGILGVDYGIARGESPLDGRLHLRVDAVF